MESRVLAHRGMWSEPAERNTLAAFERAFAAGYGIEFDVRDLDGTLVVSHDPPRRGALGLSAVIDMHNKYPEAGPLGINIKADGLHGALSRELSALESTDWFVFDMSVPDAVAYVRSGLPTFTRHSNVETEPVLYADAAGVWLDDFSGSWLSKSQIETHLDAGKSVAVVSPELHGHDHVSIWQQWRQWDTWGRPELFLCTDHPQEAQEIFR